MKKSATRLTKALREVPQALGLVRASGEKQDVERQNADLDALEERYGIQVSHRLEIEGLSGTAMLTDADVNRILNELKNPIYSGLAISAIDRLVRPGVRDYTAYSIFQKFVDAHKPFWSKREGFVEPWTPEGHDKCIQSANRAGAELSELSRRSMDEKKVLARKGINCAGQAPYGYRFEKPGRRQGRWVIDEKQAEVVREIFRRAAQLNWSGYRIAQWLNQETDILAPRAGKVYKRRDGTEVKSSTGWQSPVVRNMFRNRAYIGEARFRLKTGESIAIQTEPILKTPAERHWWDQTQVSLSKWKEFRAGRPASTFLLQHLLFCSRCQTRACGRRAGGNRRIYRCLHIDRSKYGAERLICTAPQIECRLLDDLVYNTILDGLNSRAAVLALVEAHRKAVSGKRAPGTDKTQVLARLRATVELLKINLNDPDLVKYRDENKRKLFDAESEIATVEHKMEAPREVFEMPSMKAVDLFLKIIADAREWTDFKDRRGFIERTVTKVEFADRTVRIEGRISFMKGVSPMFSDARKSQGCIDNPATFVPFVFNAKIAA